MSLKEAINGQFWDRKSCITPLKTKDHRQTVIWTYFVFGIFCWNYTLYINQYVVWNKIKNKMKNVANMNNPVNSTHVCFISVTSFYFLHYKQCICQGVNSASFLFTLAYIFDLPIILHGSIDMTYSKAIFQLNNYGASKQVLWCSLSNDICLN